MAMAVTPTDNQVVGARRTVSGTIAMDNSYPTGGLAFPMASIGAKSLINLELDPNLGRLFAWDRSKTAPKVLAYQDVTPAATAALPEVVNATNLTAHTAVGFVATIEY